MKPDPKKYDAITIEEYYRRGGQRLVPSRKSRINYVAIGKLEASRKSLYGKR